jgi:ATP-dependent DNA helicase PIF1
MNNNNQEYSCAQQNAFDKYIQGHNIFITGPGGTGKSKLIRDMKEDATKRNKNVQVCAMTGCAAVLLECKAKTIHSWAGIGIASGTMEDIQKKMMKKKIKKKDWNEVDILIIDEVSMMSQKIFELLNIIGKKTRKNPKPFGGIQVVFSGDFYQLPPVGNKDEIETMKFCFESTEWFNVFLLENHIQLTRIFRQSDPVYTNILNQIREGRIKKSTCTILQQRVKSPNSTDENVSIIPTKLFPTRNKVDLINQMEMVKLKTDEIEYKLKYNEDLPMTEKEKQQRLGFTKEEIKAELQYMQSNLLCEETIRLKVGSQVMCIVNIELPNGTMICNGSQGIVTHITDNKNPIVKYNNGPEQLVNYHVWQSENIPGIGISQLPLILAWALTIHKCQGASMDCAEIDVGNSIFECGQTYVALSRVKSLEGLYLTSFNPSRITIYKKVRDFYDKLKLQDTQIENTEIPTSETCVESDK